MRGRGRFVNASENSLFCLFATWDLDGDFCLPFIIRTLHEESLCNVYIGNRKIYT